MENYKNLINKLKKNFKYIFWSAIFLLLVLKFFLTVNPNPSEFLDSYKFVSNDGYDWIVNGLLLFKNDNITFRNPGLVLIIKILDFLHLLFLLPLLNQLVLFGIIFVIYRLAYIFTEKSLFAYLSATAVFMSYALQGFTNFLLSDIYAVFFISLSLFFLAKNKKVFSFLCLGLSTLFQNFAFFIFPILFIYSIVTETSLNRIFRYILENFTKLFAYLLVFLNFNIFWFIYKFIKFGSPLYSQVTQFGLLKAHLDSALFYTINSYSMFGLLFVISVGVAFYALYKHKDKLLVFTSICFLFTLIFWVFLYDWDDRRFLLYCVPFVYPLSAIFFSKIKIKSYIYRIILFFICIYPSTISVGGVFNGARLPITNWQLVEFETMTFANDKSKLALPVKFVTKDFPIIAVFSPSYAEIFNNYEINKFSKETQFYHYKNEILTSGTSSKDLCTITRSTSRGDIYMYNNVLRIVQYRNCGNTSF